MDVSENKSTFGTTTAKGNKSRLIDTTFTIGTTTLAFKKRVKICTPCSNYSGEIDTIDRNGRITLKHAMNLDTHERIKGLQMIFTRHITAAEILDPLKPLPEELVSCFLCNPPPGCSSDSLPDISLKPSSKPSPSECNSVGQSKRQLTCSEQKLSTSNTEPTTIIRTKTFQSWTNSEVEELVEVHPREVRSVEVQTKNEPVERQVDGNIRKKCQTGSENSRKKLYLKTDRPSVLLCVILELDNKFYKALKHILSQDVVGVAAEGVSLGRCGKLSLLQIDTREMVYIFDMHFKAQEFLSEGLKDILENDTILKVMHDCRPLGDNLHHKFNITLNNVFDTQITDIYHYKMMTVTKNNPCYVRNLVATLVSYLQLDVDAVQFYQVRFRLEQKDSQIWERRPIDRYLLHIAVKNVVYLRSLREVMLEKIQETFLNGARIFLTCVRCSTVPLKYRTSPKGKKKIDKEDFDNSGYKIEAVDRLSPYMNFPNDYWADEEIPKKQKVWTILKSGRRSKRIVWLVREPADEIVKSGTEIKLTDDSEIVAKTILESSKRALNYWFDCKRVHLPNEVTVLKRLILDYPYMKEFEAVEKAEEEWKRGATVSCYKVRPWKWSPPGTTPDGLLTGYKMTPLKVEESDSCEASLLLNESKSKDPQPEGARSLNDDSNKSTVSLSSPETLTDTLSVRCSKMILEVDASDLCGVPNLLLNEDDPKKPQMENGSCLNANDPIHDNDPITKYRTKTVLLISFSLLANLFSFIYWGRRFAMNFSI